MRASARGAYVQAIPRNKGAAFNPKLSSPQMEIFAALASDMDPEGRHLFINAIANQLRYPNVHTHFFSCVLLYLFLEAPKVCCTAAAICCPWAERIL